MISRGGLLCSEEGSTGFYGVTGNLQEIEGVLIKVLIIFKGPHGILRGSKRVLEEVQGAL